MARPAQTTPTMMTWRKDIVREIWIVPPRRGVWKMEVTAAETPNLHKLFCLRKLTFTIL